MAVNPSPLGPKPQFVLATGLPATGYKLYSYAAGSSTKQNTYTDSTGNTANSNPLTLNSLGQPTNELWFTAGQSYKLLLTADTTNDPPQSSVWSIDNLEGINDTSVSIDQWVASGLTPTYVSATSFTLAGDQTTEFHVGRRLKTTNSGGTVYSRITASAYGALTTVTVVNDSGSLDSGLSAVSYGLLTATNHSIPAASPTFAGLTLESADTGAGAGPDLNLYRNSASPAANDVIGVLYYKGEDSAGNTETYGDIFGEIIDPTSTSEDSRLGIQTVIAGTLGTRFFLGHGLYTGALTDPGDGAANLKNVLRNGYQIGKLLQQVHSSYPDYTGLTTTIAFDNSIPQNTEGTEILTAAITPKNASSTLRIRAELQMGSDTLGAMLIGALFVDSTADALRAVSQRSDSTDSTQTLSMEYQVSAASTSARTYKIRVGADSGTWYTNGNGTSRKFGGVSACTLTVEEIDA
jgi:hypothetical protein